jgi:two-component system, response regulator
MASDKYLVLAEDNPDDVALTIRALAKCQVKNRLVVISDGREMINFLLSGLQEKPALIMLDLKMPFIDGLEILRTIRASEDTRQLPVVVMTSSIDEKDRQKSLQLGASEFFCKPIIFDEFVALMKQICTRWLSD